MPRNDSDDADEPTLRELEARKEQLDDTGWDSTELEDDIEAKDRQRQLLLERSRLAESLRNDDLPDHVREEYETQIAEIDDLIAEDRRREAEELRQRADNVELTAEQASNRDGWDDLVERAPATAEELRTKADEIDPDVDSEALSTPASSPSSASTTTVDVNKAVRLYRQNYSGIHPDYPDTFDPEALVDAHRSTAEFWESKHSRARARSNRARVELLEAYLDGERTIEFDKTPPWYAPSKMAA